MNHKWLIGSNLGRRGQGSGPRDWEPEPGNKLWAWRKPHLILMAFLVSGTLQASAQLLDACDNLGRKVVRCSTWASYSQHSAGPQLSPALAFLPQGKYSVRGSRVALALSSPGVSATAVAALDGVSQALGFEICEKREVPVQVSFCPVTLSPQPQHSLLAGASTDFASLS